MGGHPSQQIEFTYNDPNIGNAKSSEVISIIGDKYYVISYVAVPLQFASKSSIFDHMIDSFAIGPATN